jgi:hypothetical protein
MFELGYFEAPCDEIGAEDLSAGWYSRLGDHIEV